MYIVTRENNVFRCEGEVKNFPCNARMVRLTDLDTNKLFVLNSDDIYAVVDNDQGKQMIEALQNGARSSNKSV